MVDVDERLKTSLPPRMPQQLASELVKMRRNPADFEMGLMATCKFGCDMVKGSRSSYQLVVSGEVAGAWCPIHGWAHFDSVSYPPTERLSKAEQADNRAALARKRGPRV